MKLLLWAVIVFITFIAQASISLFDITPNLTVVLAFYAGTREGEIKGLFYGSLIGTVEDSLSGAFLGPHLLAKGLAGYFSSLVYSRLFIWTPLFGVISMIMFTFADGIAVFMLRSIFDGMPASVGAALYVIFIQALMNAPFGLFLRPGDR
jgi:rod shape-determining protein MreD